MEDELNANGERVDEKGRRIDWSGGYIRYNQKGRATYYIYKRIKNHLYESSTRTHAEREANAHLSRFLENPDAYDPRGYVGKEPVYLTAALIDEFMVWSGRPETEGGRGNTREWRGKQRRTLKWWATNLVDERGRALNLRALDLDKNVLKPLDGDRERNVPPVTDRATKIRVLKTLFSWLREVRHRIEPAEDPTYGKLTTPQAGSSQRRGKNKVTTRENVENVIEYLTTLAQVKQPGKQRPEKALSIYADALTVQAGTGWHTTEICRFVRDGLIESPPPGAEPDEVAVLVVMHKSGKEHKTRVTQRVLDAAKRLQTPRLHLGKMTSAISQTWYDRAVRDACYELKIPRFTPANMRHTNSQTAVDAGIDPKVVSSFHGHSEATSKKFYATHAVVARVPNILDDVNQPKKAAAELREMRKRVQRLEEELARAKTAAVDTTEDDDVTAGLEALLAKVKKKRLG